MLQSIKSKLTDRNGDAPDRETDGSNTTTTTDADTNGASTSSEWGTNGGLTPDELPDDADAAVTPVSASSAQVLVRGARFGEKFCKVMYIPRGGWPSEPAPGLLDRLTAHSSAGVQVKLRVDPMDRDRAISEFKRRVSKKNKELYAKQQASAPDTAVVADEKEELENVLRAIKSGSETVYWVGCYFVIRAPSKKQVDDAADEIQRDLGKDDLSVTSADWVQADGMTTVSPVGTLALPETTRTPMTGSALGCLFPFSTSSMIEESENAILYGYHALNQSPVMVDRWNRESGHNKLVVAEIRQGKSYGEKLDLARELALDPELRAVIIDPRGGFKDLVDTFGDDAETITVGGTVGINPLHIEPTPRAVLRESPDLDPFAQKHSFALSFLETAATSSGDDIDSGATAVSAIERAVLSEALTRGYASVGITADPNTHSRDSPLIGDVRTVLGGLSTDPASVLDEELSEREVTKWSETASGLKMALRPVTEGALSHFNKPTAVNLAGPDSKRLVLLDLVQSEAAGSLPLDMKVYLGSIYEAGKLPGKMRLTADEIHHMMDTPTGLKWFEDAFRYSGHFDLGITAITQTADEFFVNERAKTIADLCSIKQFYRTPGLTQEHAEKLGLTERERRFVRNATPGDRTRGWSHSLLSIDDLGTVPIRVEAISEREENAIDPVTGGSTKTPGNRATAADGGRF